MLRYLAILAILPAVILAQGNVPFTACNAGGTLPNWVYVRGCNMDECLVRHGEEIFMEGEIVTVDSAERADLTIHAFLPPLTVGIPMPLPDELADGCHAFTNGCPVTHGTTYRVYTGFPVWAPEQIQNRQPFIELAITNERGVRLLCARVRVTVVA